MVAVAPRLPLLLFCVLLNPLVGGSRVGGTRGVDPRVVEPVRVELQRSGDSVLYSLQPKNSTDIYSDGDPLLAVLVGNRSEIGQAYAKLLGGFARDSYELLFSSLLPNKIQRDLVLRFLDFCWSHWLSQHVPLQFQAELSAMRLADAVSSPHLGTISQRMITLETMPADTQNIIALLEREMEGEWPGWLSDGLNDVIAALEHIFRGTQHGDCDFFAVWGSRTPDGSLLSSRNLDWHKATGVSRNKLITVYEPSDGSASYATVGFAGLYGALAGVSQRGMTVSQNNLDNSMVSFDGVAWPLRLRQVLEDSSSLKEALSLWGETVNTGSANFLIGSELDKAAVAIENIYNTTGVFSADSALEANATYTWPGDAKPSRIGYPLKDAVFRSNHGLHPHVMKTQEPLWNDTVARYNMLHDELSARGVMSARDAVTVAAILGIKGDDYYSCNPATYSLGSHIMSIVYEPARDRVYVAWENGGWRGSVHPWTPAGCNPYYSIPMDWAK